MPRLITPSTLLTFSPSLRRPYATEAVFKTSPYRLHRLDAGPAPAVTLKKDDALVLYERMATIRRMENEINKLYKSRVVVGFCHLYSGQEAVAVGFFANLRPHDTAITTYRSHAWAYLFHGLTTHSVIAEVSGVQSGSSRGKGGSMHIFGKNFYGGQAIVGAHVPIGVGVALAHKYRSNGAVSVTIMGDGATNSGQVGEAYNMAKLWDLPCLFLVENNHYSMGTSVPRSTPNPDFYKKGDMMPGVWMDGMDVVSVKEGARFCMEYVTAGKGPILAEANTYRYFGHSLSDPGTTYRTREEVHKVRETQDPLTIFKTKIMEAALVTEAELKVVDDKIKAHVKEGLQKAKKDKKPPAEELTYDIYANEVIKEVRGVSPFKPKVHKSTGQAYNLK